MKRQRTVSKGYTVLIAVIAITALIFSTVAGTLAWLEAKSETLVNTFEAGKVPIEVEETTTGSTKDNVRVTNNGNIPAYIRVAVIPVWREADGKTGTGLDAKDTYNIDWNMYPNSKWVEYKGYYYYTEPVPAETTIPENEYLFTNCYPLSDLPDEYEGKVFEMQVIASSIQSEPPEAIADAWGVAISSGSVTPAS